MRKKLRIRKVLGRFALIGAAVGVGAIANASGQAEADPKPDPAEVTLFLDRLERGPAEEAERRKGYEKRLLNVVEDAANRAPSDAMINRIEKSVIGKLG